MGYYPTLWAGPERPFHNAAEIRCRGRRLHGSFGARQRALLSPTRVYRKHSSVLFVETTPLSAVSASISYFRIDAMESAAPSACNSLRSSDRAKYSSARASNHVPIADYRFKIKKV